MHDLYHARNKYVYYTQRSAGSMHLPLGLLEGKWFVYIYINIYIERALSVLHRPHLDPKTCGKPQQKGVIVRKKSTLHVNRC